MRIIKTVGKLAVLTSGGDSPGMNAAVRAVVRTGIYFGYQVFGVRRGYCGLIQGDFIELNRRSVGDIIHRGGTILLTARCPELRESGGMLLAVDQLRQHQIETLIVIGGDGSLQGAAQLEKHGVKTIGIPATIDNDIGGTDNTIGYDTCLNTIVEAVNRLRDTATSHERIFVVEVMGRHAGFLALEAGVASGAESILMPEVNFSIEDVCTRIERGYQEGKKHHIIIVAEGAAHAVDVASAISQRTGHETRVTVLGHIQRGGAPSAQDRLLASVLGYEAVHSAVQGCHGVMVGMQNGCTVLVSYDNIPTSKPIDGNLHETAETILSR